MESLKTIPLPPLTSDSCSSTHSGQPSPLTLEFNLSSSPDSILDTKYFDKSSPKLCSELPRRKPYNESQLKSHNELPFELYGESSDRLHTKLECNTITSLETKCCLYCDTEYTSEDSVSWGQGLCWHCTHRLDLSQQLQCHACDEPIYGSYYTAENHFWHPNHFQCTICQVSLSDDFCLVDGNVYCPSHGLHLFSHPCRGCESPILGPHLKTHEDYWHHDCFRCTDCHTTLSATTPALTHGSDYLCPSCSKRRRTCLMCDLPLTGLSLALKHLQHRLHPHHLLCHHCHHPLPSTGFSTLGPYPTCATCPLSTPTPLPRLRDPPQLITVKLVLL